MADIYQLPSGESVYEQGGKIINAKTGLEVGTNAPATFTPSIVSSEKGLDLLQQKQQVEQQISPKAAPPEGYSYTKPSGQSYVEVATPSGPAYKVTGKGTAPSTTYPAHTAEGNAQQAGRPTSITLINPSTDQKITLDTLDQGQLQRYLNSGWTISEASGSIPGWIRPSANGMFSTLSNPQLDKARSEVDDARRTLANLNIDNNPVLQRMLDSISQQWDRRIASMETAVNSQNAATITTGMRLGSRYTGDMFKGILSEQERQGIQKVADLQSQKDEALLQARIAFQDKEWSRYSKMVDQAEQHYKSVLDEVSTLNRTIVEQTQKENDKRRLSSMDSAISGLIAQGTTDPKKILDYLNYYDSGDPTGLNATAKEVADSIKNLTGSSDLGAASSDLKDFNYIKSTVGLPANIASLPPEQQFLAWQKQLKEANSTDPSTRYQVITDPVTGNQTIFDRQSGSFVGGQQPSGTKDMDAQSALILNAAKTIAVKDPTAGKLLVRTINDKLSSGDTDGAMKFLKDAAYNTLPQGQQEDYVTYENAVSALQQALQLINSSSISTGPYKALFQKSAPYLEIERDPQYAQLNALIGLASAQIRRGFFGTAVTAAEGGTANKFLIDDTDSIENIKTKMRGAMAFFSFVNDATIARSTGLPKPDLSQYLAQFGVGDTVDPVRDFLSGAGNTTTATPANPAGI